MAFWSAAKNFCYVFRNKSVMLSLNLQNQSYLKPADLKNVIVRTNVCPSAYKLLTPVFAQLSDNRKLFYDNKNVD